MPSEVDDPLLHNSYHGTSGSLQEELLARLAHTGPIYRQDNSSVYLKIEEAARGTAVESTLKSFARSKDGRAAFLALISNHADATKYRTISKKRLSFLLRHKWNGRNHPLETHVSNHRVAYDDLRDCSAHVTVTVPNPEQRVEYLIDSINNSDTTLQAAIGLVRANTNNMRSDFEAAASSLIEVDPYHRSSRNNPNTGRTANVSAIDFSGGRGNTGVDLRWHPTSEFKALPEDQKDELMEWLNNTNEGKKERADQRKAFKKRKHTDEKYKHKKSSDNKSWKKKLKSKMKTPNGLATVMSLIADEEKSNSALVASLTAAAAAANNSSGNNGTSDANASANVSALAKAAPVTQLKLTSILKKANHSG